MSFTHGHFLYEFWVARWSLLAGLWTTVSTSILTILIGSALGLVLGLMLTYGIGPIRWLARLYVDLIRGIPVLVLILFTYYGLALFKINVSPYWAGVIALSAFCVSHVAETVRGAIQSVPAGQDEAAKAIGLPFLERVRYVILPQALRRVLPPWVNTALEMVKGTTLLSVIGVVELLLASQQAIARNYLILQFYLAAALFYFVVNFAIGQLAAALERRFRRFKY